MICMMQLGLRLRQDSCTQLLWWIVLQSFAFASTKKWRCWQEGRRSLKWSAYLLDLPKKSQCSLQGLRGSTSKEGADDDDEQADKLEYPQLGLTRTRLTQSKRGKWQLERSSFYST